MRSKAATAKRTDIGFVVEKWIVYLIILKEGYSEGATKCYVGFSNSPLLLRWARHVQSARWGLVREGSLPWAIRKWGADAFRKRVLCTVDSKQEAQRLEIEEIAKRNTRIPRGMNGNRGGVGGNTGAKCLIRCQGTEFDGFPAFDRAIGRRHGHAYSRIIGGGWSPEAVRDPAKRPPRRRRKDPPFRYWRKERVWRDGRWRFCIVGHAKPIKFVEPHPCEVRGSLKRRKIPRSSGKLLKR
jgi:hypothetical protein